MSGRRTLGRLADNGRNTAKPLPAILNRKRKNDQDDLSQPDLHNFFTSSNSKDDMVENLQGVSFSNIQISRRPPTSSRVPLSTLSNSSENIVSQPLSSNTTPGLGSYALKLPTLRHQSDPSQSSSSPSQRIRDRKQTLSWKKPRMRKSWSEFRSFITEPVPTSIRGSTPLPQLAWADRQEIWDLMAKKESGMYKRQSVDSLLSRHPDLQPRMRAILLDWLIEVCEVYRLHRETFYLAVDFIDRFLSVAPAVPKNRLQLIGVSCLFIGAKIEEIYPPKLQEFAYVTDGACTEEQILNMELMILKGLNWGLSPMTPNAWMRMYLQIAHGSTRPMDESFSLPAYSGLPFSRVMQLLDLAILDVGSLEFNYSVLATSALYHTESEAIALAVSGYSWEDIASCVRWMSAFAYALRERSPLQPKSFHGVQPDDAHHLQTHSMDLALLERAQDRLRALAVGQLRESPDPTSHTALPPFGLDNTPNESDGDVLYEPEVSHAPTRQQIAPHPALLSPPLDSDIW